jgi:hypothetical protein
MTNHFTTLGWALLAVLGAAALLAGWPQAIQPQFTRRSTP